MNKYNNASVARLYRAIRLLHSEAECRAFFEDLCTIKELSDMAQRFETAILLDEGQSYQSISEKVNISSATISRVNRALCYGSDGYKTAIQKLKANGEIT